MIIADDFLQHAKRLIDPKNTPVEADCRSAVSRAYYSLYHEAKAALMRNNDIIPTHDTHKFVSKTLYSKNKKIGLKYKSFRDDRNNADYCLALSSFNRANSEVIVKEIEKMIQQVKVL